METVCTTAHPICTHARPLAGQHADPQVTRPGYTHTEPARPSLEDDIWKTRHQEGHGTISMRQKEALQQMALSFLPSAMHPPVHTSIRPNTPARLPDPSGRLLPKNRNGGKRALPKPEATRQTVLMQIRYLARIEDLASRDIAGSSAQTHHSAGVQPGDHSWQTGQSVSHSHSKSVLLLGICTLLLLFLYLRTASCLAGPVGLACLRLVSQ